MFLQWQFMLQINLKFKEKALCVQRKMVPLKIECHSMRPGGLYLWGRQCSISECN